jgi:hypothetical protein
MPESLYDAFVTCLALESLKLCFFHFILVLVRASLKFEDIFAVQIQFYGRCIRCCKAMIAMKLCCDIARESSLLP